MATKTRREADSTPRERPFPNSPVGLYFHLGQDLDLLFGKGSLRCALFPVETSPDHGRVDASDLDHDAARHGAVYVRLEGIGKIVEAYCCVADALEVLRPQVPGDTRPDCEPELERCVH